MKIYYWNLNNNNESIRILKENYGAFSNSFFAFSEYWEISENVESLAEQFRLERDFVNMRTGLFCEEDLSFLLKRFSKYYSIYTILYNDIEILLFVVHFRSQRRSELDAKRHSELLSSEINKVIREQSCRYIIIVGDFNLPHFEEIFLSFNHFNATNYYSDDLDEVKSFDGIDRLKFYNPISALNGDMSIGPPGTYYYNKGSQSQSWLTFDQALISYPLAKYLNKAECRVLTEIGNINLLTKNSFPNKKYSDHLPIKIEFI